MIQYAYRDGRVRTLKAGVNFADYLANHPDAIKVCKPPTTATLERWNERGGCKAVDGCWVEPDGTCQHGNPSWLRLLAYI